MVDSLEDVFETANLHSDVGKTLSHLSRINRLGHRLYKKHILYRDLANARGHADEKAVKAVNNWFNEMQLLTVTGIKMSSYHFQLDCSAEVMTE